MSNSKVNKQLSIQQIAAIKEDAERILLYYEEPDIIQKMCNHILWLLDNEPLDSKIKLH